MKSVFILAPMACLLLGSVSPVLGADPGVALRAKYRSCEALNVKYPHGVGLPGAVDTTIKDSPAVTNFKVDKKIYYLLWAGSKRGLAKGEKFGGSYDRDKDGIACEEL